VTYLLLYKGPAGLRSERRQLSNLTRTSANMFKSNDTYSMMEGGGSLGDMYASEFTEASVRKGFVRKVFGALSPPGQR
jgi:hypothetical protein